MEQERSYILEPHQGAVASGNLQPAGYEGSLAGRGCLGKASGEESAYLSETAQSPYHGLFLPQHPSWLCHILYQASSPHV